jgi:ribonuclease P protein component
MPRKYRLTGEEIKDLSGRRFHGRFFSLLVASLSSTHAKCACVVSKKVSARAVDRNLIKRRCRAALSAQIATIESPIALVFSAKREALGAPLSEVKRDVEALLNRLPAGNK